MIFSDNIEKYYYALCSSIQSLKWAVLVKTPGYCSKPHGTWPHDTIPCIVLSPEALGHMSGPPESPWKIDTNRVIYCWFENFRLNYLIVTNSNPISNWKKTYIAWSFIVTTGTNISIIDSSVPKIVAFRLSKNRRYDNLELIWVVYTTLCGVSPSRIFTVHTV